MKKTTLSMLLLTSLMVVACGGNDPTPTTKFNLTVPADKKDSTIKYCSSYSITDTEESFFTYQKVEAEGGKFTIDITGKTELDVIIIPYTGKMITNASVTYEGNNVTDIIKRRKSMDYHCFEIKNLGQKNSELTVSYEVVDAKYDVTIGSFIAPTSDPNGYYNDLYFNASVNGNEITYKNDKKIKASELEAALKSVATNNVIQVEQSKGIKVTGFFNDSDCFFNESLNLSSLYQSDEFEVESRADYIDFKSELSAYPIKNGTFTLDFANLATKNYRDYSLKSYKGRSSDTTGVINYKQILVDGNPVTKLTNNTIKNATNVVIEYDKSAFGVDDASIYNGGSVMINDDYYPYSTPGEAKYRAPRLTATADTVSVVLKSNELPALYWYTSWLNASTDARHNLVDKHPCILQIERFSVPEK